ncbi:MAG: hypothetical protein ACJAYF_002592, partial [Arenicella sp.]
MNKKGFCISWLFYRYLSAGLMLANVAQAQESVLPEAATLSVSQTTDKSLDTASAKAEVTPQKLPTAENVDLKEVVTEAEEAVPSATILPAPSVSLAIDKAVDGPPITLKRKKQKLPTAPNVDLKDVVDESEELVPSENALPKSTVTSENDLLPVGSQSLIEEQT